MFPVDAVRPADADTGHGALRWLLEAHRHKDSVVAAQDTEGVRSAVMNCALAASNAQQVLMAAGKTLRPPDPPEALQEIKVVIEPPPVKYFGDP